MSLLTGFIYCLHDIDNDICRIGQTADYQLERVKSQIKYYPFEIKYATIRVDYRDLAEKYFHNLFLDKKIGRGSDWFNITLDDFKKESEIYRIAFKSITREDFYSQATFQNKINDQREAIVSTIIFK